MYYTKTEQYLRTLASIRPRQQLNLTYVITIEIFFLLIVGGILYLLYRPYDLMMFSWIESIGMLEDLIHFRQLINGKPHLPDFIIYSFPNTLWVYSLLSFLYLNWKQYPIIFFSLYGLVSMIVVFLEVSQAIFPVLGTFSWADLNSTFITLIIHQLIHFKINK